MRKEQKFAQELVDFLYESPSCFHAVSNVKSRLVENGFAELKGTDEWKIEKGQKYYTTVNDTALVAFVAGTGEVEEHGFKLVGAHTDSPGFRIKPNPEMTVANTYVRLNTEIYGGPILYSWFDRPLGIAGRVTLRTDNPLKPESKLVNINKPVVIIPSLAIHMNREMNQGVEFNPQQHTLPLISTVNEQLEKGDYFLGTVAKELGVEISDILDFELYLYEYEKGCVMGLHEEFISSGRLDDLQNIHSGLEALLETEAAQGTNVLVAFDNEEIGSRTKQGADSPMLTNILERIVASQGKGREAYFRALANSFIISADNAHALHPAYPEKNDPTNKPVINGGPVIKINANQNYSTDSESCATYKMLCEKAGVPCQVLVNRSDVKGGSTIGPVSATQLNIKSVDIGVPQFAMHSIREFAGVQDHYDTYKTFVEFFKL